MNIYPHSPLLPLHDPLSDMAAAGLGLERYRAELNEALQVIREIPLSTAPSLDPGTRPEDVATFADTVHAYIHTHGEKEG